jgi:drug/metabolite transporter (DMT)-like permease
MSASTRQPPVPPLAVITLGILAVSTASIFIRYAQNDASSLVIAFYRLALATLVLAPLALARHREELRSLRRKDVGLALVSGIFLALHFATWITSLEFTSVASSAVLVSTVPLFVGLLAPVFLREPPGRVLVTGMLLALAGGVIVGLSDTCSLSGLGLACPPLDEFMRGQAFLGDLLALAGALAAAAYVMIGRGLRSRVSLVSYIFLVYGFAALSMLAVIAIRGLPLLGYPAQAYIWFGLLALVPQLIGHSSFNWALGYLPAAMVSITLLGEPIGSTILAYLLFHEQPTPLKLFGAVLILVGIMVASQQKSQQP